MSWAYNFHCDRMNTKEAWEIDQDTKSQVFVIPGMVDRGEDLVADGPRFVLSDFVQGMPELQKKDTTRHAVLGANGMRSKEQAAEWKRLLDQYPWLSSKVARKDAKEKKALGKVADAPGDGDVSSDSTCLSDLGDAVEDVLDEEAVDGIFDSLAALREDWCAKFASVELADFSTGLLGGESTFKMTKTKTKEGVVADYVCCETKSAAAKAFAKSYGLHQSKRASISLYGMGAATTLTEALGHRMQFYLDRHRSSGNPVYTFTVADHNSYSESDAFVRLVELDEAAMDAARSIRAVMPFYC